MAPSPHQPLPADFAEIVARRFAVLGEPTRIRLLDCLIEHGELSVQELSERLELPYANVSKHLNVLHGERIAGRRKQATKVLYRITDETILGVCRLVCGGLREQLRELGALAESPGVSARVGTGDPGAAARRILGEEARHALRLCH